MNESLSPSLDSTCPAWLHRTKQQRQNYWGPSWESNVAFPLYDQESNQTFNMLLRTRAIRPVPQSIPPMSPFDVHPFQLCTYLRLTGQNHPQNWVPCQLQVGLLKTPQVSRYISVWWFGSLMVLKFRSITMHSSLHRSWHIVASAWSLPSWVSWLLVCGVSPWI